MGLGIMLLGVGLMVAGLVAPVFAGFSSWIMVGMGAVVFIFGMIARSGAKKEARRLGAEW